jgi:hypothetical protein
MNSMIKTVQRLGLAAFVLLASGGSLLAQTPNLDDVPMHRGGGVGFLGGIVYLAVVVFLVAALWKVFTKAGQPGWACLVPFYNLFILCKIAGRPGWWLLLFFVPLANIVIHFIVAIDIAKRFGKGAGFGIGVVFLPFIFYPILGFGDATYQGTAA